MAPLLTETELAKLILKLQELLQALETLICEQSGYFKGDFDDLMEKGFVKASKKDRKALFAGRKARQALQEKQSTKQALQDLNKKKASHSEIIAARKARYDAEQLTKDEVTRAVGFLDNAINARKGSHTRQEQAKAAIEQAQNTDASEAQLTRNRLAREAREAAARQAQETAVREAQEAAARQARQAQEAAVRQAQETAAREIQEANERQTREDRKNEIPHSLTQYYDLQVEDLSLAIASLAVGIEHAGGPICPIATDLLQAWARLDARHGVTCLRNPNRFIIPVLIGGGMPVTEEEEIGGSTNWDLSDDQAQAIWDEQAAIEENEVVKAAIKDVPVEHKGKQEPWHHGVGHLILVIAEREGVDVKFEISNSLSSYGNKDQARGIFRNIVRLSGWMEDRGRPRFVDEKYNPVSGQEPGSNACGTHVILNAWAYLLGLEVDEFWEPSEDLYDQAMRLINKALRGVATAREIEEWLILSTFAEPRSWEDDQMDVIMTAHTARMNQAIYAKYLEESRTDEIMAAMDLSAAPSVAPTVAPPTGPRTAAPPPGSPRPSPRSMRYVSNTDSSEDDDAPAPAPNKIRINTAVEQTSSNPPSDAFEQLNQLLEQDEHANQAADDEDDEPPAKRLRSSKYKASTPAIPPPAVKPKAKAPFKAKAKPARKPRRIPSPLLAKAKAKAVEDIYTSEMTIEERKKAFGLVSGSYCLQYARELGIIVPDKIARNLAMVSDYLAESVIRVPLLAIDIWERERLPLRDETILDRWRQSERPPDAPGAIPTKNAMTRTQRCAALNCLQMRKLQSWGAKNGVKKSWCKRKADVIQDIVNAMTDIPDHIYDLWIQKGCPQSEEQARRSTVRYRPGARELFAWIFKNMDSQKDPAYRHFIKKLREKVDDLLGGRAAGFIHLNPPGFDKSKRFPCLMYETQSVKLIELNLNPENEIGSKEAVRIRRPVKVEIQLTAIAAQLLINGDKDRLSQMGSWGKNKQVSHLCHSK
ncbi:MAG: hypothetical protein Q9161_006719 [Pseudevernia consocians]